jgi:hypothetical protein
MLRRSRLVLPRPAQTAPRASRRPRDSPRCRSLRPSRAAPGHDSAIPLESAWYWRADPPSSQSPSAPPKRCQPNDQLKAWADCTGTEAAITPGSAIALRSTAESRCCPLLPNQPPHELSQSAAQSMKTATLGGVAVIKIPRQSSREAGRRGAIDPVYLLMTDALEWAAASCCCLFATANQLSPTSLRSRACESGSRRIPWR